MLTGRPVKFVYSREEEMQVSSPRAAERIYIKDGVMKDGRIVARKVTALRRRRRLFAPLALRRARRRAAHMPGPYTIPNVWVDCLLRLHQPHAVLAPCAASASPSATSRSKCRWTGSRALLGMDPLEFRFINAYRDGDMKAHRKIAEGAALIEVHAGGGRARRTGRSPTSSRRCRR